MRSNQSRALLAVLGLCLLLGGCARTVASGPLTVRVGVALYQQDDTFIASVAQQLERLAQSEEQERKIKINLSIADGRASQTVQNEQIDRFLAQGCNVICVNLVDRTAAAFIIDKAQAAGVPILFFNREPVEEDLSRWEKAYYIGADGAQSGRLQGQLVLNAWREDSDAIDRNRDGVLQYVMLEGEPGHQDALLRTENCVKVLSRAGVRVEKLANDSANWQRGQAISKMGLWLERFGSRIEVVFANNDDMALGAIDACQSAGIPADRMPFIVGVDATPPALEALESGLLQGTVKNDANGQAQAMIQLACALATGEPVEQAVDLRDGKYVRLPYQKVAGPSPAEPQEGASGGQTAARPPGGSDAAFSEIQ